MHKEVYIPKSRVSHLFNSCSCSLFSMFEKLVYSVSRYTRITFFFWTSLWYKHFTSKLIYRTRKYWHPLSSFISNIPLFFLSSMNVVHWRTWEIDSTNISVCIGNYLQVIGKIKKILNRKYLLYIETSNL